MSYITHKKAFADQFLTMEQVKVQAPSVFTELTTVQTSERYVHIFTPDMMEDLISDGWRPISAHQVKAKKESNKGFQKHFIALRNPKIYIGEKDKITVIPELLLVNSYDARCSFKLYMILHKHSCGNNCIVKSEELDSMDISHKGWQHREWPRLKRLILKNTQTAIDLMHKLSKIFLTPAQQKSFAQECCRARWDYTYKLTDTKALLEPLRIEDEANDMFTIYNRIQEKLIKGGWKGRSGRAIKALKDKNREVIVNARLFQIVENFVQQLQKS